MQFIPRSNIEIASRTLTHAEILAAPGDLVPIVPDPGEGKYIIPLWAILMFDSQAGYTGATTVEIDADVQLLCSGSAILERSTPTVVTMGLNMEPDTGFLRAILNQDLPAGGVAFDLRGDTEITDGHANNILTAIVGYLTVEVTG